MKFVWLPNAVTVADGLTFPQFILENVTSYSCDKDYFGSKYTVNLNNSILLEKVTSHSCDKDYFGSKYKLNLDNSILL